MEQVWDYTRARAKGSKATSSSSNPLINPALWFKATDDLVKHI